VRITSVSFPRKKAGIQPRDTMKRRRKPGSRRKRRKDKPCSVVVFWMLAFASMTHAVKRGPYSIVAVNRELIHLLFGVAQRTVSWDLDACV
jgi:hypothetical protein